MPCIYTFTEKNDLRNLTLKKSLERFIRKYIPDVRFEYHKRNPLITTVVDGSIFFFYADEKLFELFCIENDFGKYFAKFRNLSIILFRTL